MRQNHLLIISLLIMCMALAGSASAEPPEATNFVAHLSGDEEVPPVDTLATGQATFHLSDDGGALDFLLIVANIEAVTQAHIHLGSIGENGPVVAFLFGFVPGGVTTNGILAQGTITESDLVGPLGGQPLSALIEEMQNGNTYVNVHTVANPPGEIRGQVMTAGPWGR